MSAPQHSNLPTRTATNSTEDDAVPEGEDTSEVTRLFLERLQAWKHACGYLEDYVTATEKMQAAHTKEYERVLKTVSHPLKEGHHFDQSLGGIAGMFDNIRSNTQGLANSHTETAKTLKGTVLPIFERLHSEIKNKNKELTKGAGKGAKLVDKARNTTQKHVELLGQHTASFDSTGGKLSAADDPYILQRGVYHRLNKQIIEENNNRQDLLSVQNSFAQFEAHVIQTFQNGLQQFDQIIIHQADQTRTLYGDMVATTQRVAPDFEWNGFLKRNSAILIDPQSPPRSIENVSFPNQDHRATQPLIAGSLERKSKLLKKYETAFYVVTPSKFLHEFKTDDDFAKDPQPENSLYLPDCVIGALDGTKFQIKGKDASKGSFGAKLAMSHEFAFKAHTPQDAQKWYDAIVSVTGHHTNELPDTSAPTSPVDSRTASGNYPNIAQPGEAGSVAGYAPQSTTAGTHAPMAGATEGQAPMPGAAGTHAPMSGAGGAPAQFDNSAERTAAGPGQGVASYDKA